MPKLFVKKALKALLIIGSFLAVVFLGAYFILNNFYLPRHGKKLIIQQVENALKRKVRIDSLVWKFRRGLVATEVAINRKTGEGFLFEAQSVALRYSLRSLIRKKFLIRSMEVERPRITLKRDAAGRWNINDLVQKQKSAKTRIAFDNVLATNATVVIADEKGLLDKLNITQYRLLIRHNRDKSYRFDSSGISSIAGTKFVFDGLIGSSDRPIQFSIESKNLRPKLFLEKFAPEFPLKFSDTPSHIKCDFKIRSANQWDTRLKFRASDFTVTSKDKWSAVGDVAASASVSFDPHNPKDIAYNGSIHVSSTTFRLAELDRKFEDCHGRLSLSNEHLSSKDIKGRWRDCEITADFDIKGFDIGLLEMSNDVVGPTAQLISFSEALDKASSELEFDGDVHALIKINGLLNTMPDVEVKATLENNEIRYPWIKQPVKNANGEIHYTSNHISLPRLSGLYNGTDFEAKADIEIAEEDIKLDATISAGQLRTTATGSFKNQKPTHYDLVVGIEGESERLVDFLPTELRSTLLKLQPQGYISNEFHIVGGFTDASDLEIRGKVVSPKIAFGKIPFENLSGSVFLSTQVFKLYDVKADLLGGESQFAGEVDFSDQKNAYKLEAHLRKVDISALPQILESAKKNIGGKLSFDVILNGVTRDPSTLKGKGNITISEGNLWEIKLFDSLFNVLKLHVPIIGKTTFYKIKCSFLVDKQSIITRDLYFYGPVLRLMTIGKAGFDGGLKFDIDVKFFRQRGSLIEGGTRYILNLPSNIIPRLYLRGTLKEPEFRWHFLPRIPIIDNIFRNKPV